jgi:hypothetical protein
MYAAASFFFFFFGSIWVSIWDNETQSAEAFQAHPLVLLVVSQSIAGQICPGGNAVTHIF